MANGHGGKREGAGRKYGSKSRPTIFDFWDDGEIATFFEFLKDNYKEDMRLMQWVGDHLMGKPSQPLTGDGGKDLFPSEVDQMSNEELEQALAARGAGRTSKKGTSAA